MEFRMILFHPSDSVQIRLICVYVMMNVLEEILLTVGTQKHFFNQLYLKRGYFDSSDDDYEDHNLTNEDGNEVYMLRVDYCSRYSTEGLFYSPILTTCYVWFILPTQS